MKDDDMTAYSCVGGINGSSGCTEKIPGLKCGDESAISSVWLKMYPRALGVARRFFRRWGIERQSENEHDVVQTVMPKFLEYVQEDNVTLSDSQELFGLLCQFIKRGVNDKRKKDGAVKRGRHETTITMSESPWEPRGADHEPVDIVAWQEGTENLMRRLPRRDRKIIDLRMKGHKNVEIARQLRISAKTVQRAIGNARERWREAAETTAAETTAAETT